MDTLNPSACTTLSLLSDAFLITHGALGRRVIVDGAC